MNVQVDDRMTRGLGSFITNIKHETLYPKQSILLLVQRTKHSKSNMYPIFIV